jgi:Macrocin-O-methyltransferase (TylF)
LSDAISRLPQSRVKKFLSKRPADMLTSLRWNTRNLAQVAVSKLRFNLFSWAPRGMVPAYLAYYPDSLHSFPDLRPMYDKWIRGNKTNNNGDASRFMALVLNLRQLQAEGIEGDFAELGVWKGNSAALLAEFATKTGKHLFLFDTFSGFDERDLVGTDQAHKFEFGDTSVGYVRETVGHDEITTYLQGFFPSTITEEVSARTFALAHIDCDLYGPMKSALEFFYPRMPKGGMLILHDYSSGTWAGATQAVNEFSAATGEFVSLWPDKSGTAIIRKSH